MHLFMRHQPIALPTLIALQLSLPLAEARLQARMHCIDTLFTRRSHQRPNQTALHCNHKACSMPNTPCLVMQCKIYVYNQLFGKCSDTCLQSIRSSHATDRSSRTFRLCIAVQAAREDQAFKQVKAQTNRAICCNDILGTPLSCTHVCSDCTVAGAAASSCQYYCCFSDAGVAGSLASAAVAASLS